MNRGKKKQEGVFAMPHFLRAVGKGRPRGGKKV